MATGSANTWALVSMKQAWKERIRVREVRFASFKRQTRLRAKEVIEKTITEVIQYE